MQSDILIARAVYAHVNRWPDKPCFCNMETLDKSFLSCSMAMQQLSGTVVERKYIDGSFIGVWPFAVYVRISGRDTSKQFDAVATLEALNEWLSAEQLPSIGANRLPEKFQMTSLPSVAAEYENGSVDYQAVFSLTYRQTAGG